MGTIWVGTSGYNYPEWKGSFYPQELPASQMLGYYSARFSTVEINYSFYRLPSEKSIGRWAETTPDGFAFTLKAPRRITHEARLRDCQELTALFCARAQTLGPKLGVLLFQLPPYLRANVEALEEFVGWLPSGVRAAFEFRHASWLCEEVYACLRARNLALCVTDSETTTTPLVRTADYAYFRLRDEGYEEGDIRGWADTVREAAENGADVFVYFKHEEAGTGPVFARALLEAVGSR